MGIPNGRFGILSGNSLDRDDSLKKIIATNHNCHHQLPQKHLWKPILTFCELPLLKKRVTRERERESYLWRWGESPWSPFAEMNLQHSCRFHCQISWLWWLTVEETHLSGGLGDFSLNSGYHYFCATSFEPGGWISHCKPTSHHCLPQLFGSRLHLE